MTPNLIIFEIAGFSNFGIRDPHELFMNSSIEFGYLRAELYNSRCTKSTEWIWTKLAEKQVYESLRPLRSKSRKCSVRFYVVAITRFPNFPNSQLPS